jgi:hypothetical protein
MLPGAPQNKVAPGGESWPCGHPRTPENTQRLGKAGDRCRICRRRLNAECETRRRAKARKAKTPNG